MAQAPETAQIIGHSRVNLALHHLLAACRFSKQIGLIETSNQGQVYSGFWDEILQLSLGVATSSVSCIECYANELYFEGAAIATESNQRSASLICELMDQKPILEKFRKVLWLRTGNRLRECESYVQNISALIKLRNAIVHFRPEWFGEQVNHSKLSRQLEGKFETSPFLPDEGAFPRAWASHSFSIWAIYSTIEFINYFYHEAEIDNPLSKFEARAKELAGI